MSSENYVGLHGRSPFEGKYLAWRGPEEEHCVPEFWEDLDVGICPWCGRTVGWSDADEKWILDPRLGVLVLRQEAIELLLQHLRQRTDSDDLPKVWEIADMIERELDLNRPYEEAASG
jgi:hypothetical protein